jgi:cell division protein ZapA (FtsZ GTPase activity inhibitor)
LINGSLDVKTSLTLETIGNVATAINEKQNLINDNNLSISKTLNLQNSLNDLQENIDSKEDNFDLKQDKLSAGTNVFISSSFLQATQKAKCFNFS